MKRLLFSALIAYLVVIAALACVGTNVISLMMPYSCTKNHREIALESSTVYECGKRPISFQFIQDSDHVLVENAHNYLLMIGSTTLFAFLIMLFIIVAWLTAGARPAASGIFSGPGNPYRENPEK